MVTFCLLSLSALSGDLGALEPPKRGAPEAAGIRFIQASACGALGASSQTPNTNYRIKFFASFALQISLVSSRHESVRLDREPRFAREPVVVLRCERNRVAQGSAPAQGHGCFKLWFHRFISKSCSAICATASGSVLLCWRSRKVRHSCLFLRVVSRRRRCSRRSTRPQAWRKVATLYTEVRVFGRHLVELERPHWSVCGLANEPLDDQEPSKHVFLFK